MQGLMTTNNDTRIKAFRNPGYNATDIYIRNGNAAGRVVMEEMEAGAITEPAMRLNDEQAQSLMDSLWDAGFRPAGAAGSAGQAAAMQAHIDDLRMVVKATLPATVER